MQYSEWPLQVGTADSDLDEATEVVGVGRVYALETSVFVVETASIGRRSKMMLSTARVTPLRQPIVLAIIARISLVLSALYHRR